MTAGMPFTNVYPDGPAGGGGSSVGADSAQVNEQYPGMPPGAVPIHFDKSITTATTTTIWTPPAGKRFVLASAFLSSDTAMRVAVVDDVDVEGSRIVDQQIAANGGSSPNLVPVPYPSATPGQSVRVVTSGSGNVKVRVSGWLAD